MKTPPPRDPARPAVPPSTRRAFQGALMAGAAALAALMAATPAQAAFPDKPIRLVVPFAAGGPSDVLGRAIGQKIAGPLGQPVIIENRPGGGTNIAASQVARAAPDGSTLFLMMVGTQAINQAMYPNLSYDTVRDFAPVGLVASSSLMFVAHPSVPARTLPDVVKLAKAQPDKFGFASSGAGTPLHLGGELLNRSAGIRLLHVPYRGAAPALQDVLGGQIQYAMVGTPSALPHVKGGRLNAIGVTSAQRSPLAPEVPTIAETLPGYEVELVYAIVAPAGTPADVVARLNSEINKALKESDLRDNLAAQGFDVRTSTPEELGRYIRAEVAKWAPVVKESGVKPE